ncbi:MAG: hypothetical protein ACREKE_08240 [bacterium]
MRLETGEELPLPEAPRPGLTLAAVKAALKDWQGHMRRGAAIPSEDDYVAALGLIPLLPNPPAYLARTLRAFADLCVVQGRLDDAVSLLARVATGPGRKSEVFWRDYAVLLFRLALKRVAAGQVALANDALERAATLLRGPADLPEAWAAAWGGYSEMALWFERAGETLPAVLHAEHALNYAQRAGKQTEALAWLRKLAQTAQHRRGADGALAWLRRMHALDSVAWPGASAIAVQSAVGLAQAELAVGRSAGLEAIFSEVETWLRVLSSDAPALAELHLAWGLALGIEQGREHLEQAFSLRLKLWGPAHPKTLEARQAMGGLQERAEESGPPDNTPRAWDGGSYFESQVEPASLETAGSELKRLYHRLARLCHPDGAPEGEAVWRHELMVRVNQAAEVGDLFLLRALLREALSRNAASLKTPA